MPVRVTAGRMHDEPGRLVDHEHVLVLPEDGDLDRLGDERRGDRELDLDLLAAREAMALRPPLAVDEGSAGGDEPLGEST